MNKLTYPTGPSGVVPEVTPPEWRDQLVESVRQNGLVFPVVVTPQGVIVEGRSRYRAAKILGIADADIPVKVMTDEQIDKWLSDARGGELPDEGLFATAAETTRRADGEAAARACECGANLRRMWSTHGSCRDGTDDYDYECCAHDPRRPLSCQRVTTIKVDLRKKKLARMIFAMRREGRTREEIAEVLKWSSGLDLNEVLDATD